MNIRQIINAARSAFTRARRKFFTKLNNIINARRVAAYNFHMRAVKKCPRISRQEQHLNACLTAYRAKAEMVKLGIGKNSLAGIPQEHRPAIN